LRDFSASDDRNKLRGKLKTLHFNNPSPPQSPIKEETPYKQLNIFYDSKE
jgi:hypothetical protein